VSPSRKIDPLLATRFVSAYLGEPGRPFREEMARHFGVDVRTVERELPWLVKHGFLEEYPVRTGGRGQPPKMYRVPSDVDLSPDFQRGPAYFGRGERRRPRGLAGLIEENPEMADTLQSLWDLGCLAVCSRCTYHVSSHVPGPPWRTCPEHGRVPETGEDGVERWVTRPLLWNEDAWDGPAEPPPKERTYTMHERLPDGFSW
jgi:hypothetical protein